MSPQIRARLHVHPINIIHFERRTFGERIADAVAAHMGSWSFIITQSLILFGWIVYNATIAIRLLHHQGFDPYPFIFLNLALSFQAAYTGPIVMMSQNRQSSKDRAMAEHDYAVNQRAFEHLMWQNDQILVLLAAAAKTPTSSPPSAFVDTRDHSPTPPTRTA